MSRYKNILFLVAVLIVQVIGLAVQVRRPSPTGGDAPTVRLIRLWAISLMSPPEKAVHGGGSGLRSMWSNYIDLRHVRQQNQELKERVSRLQLEQAALLEDARQGQRLQTLLAFKEHYISSTVPAQVIGTSGTDQSRILTIDKGSKDGLKPDMAVITPDGIVGKLRDVFGSTSQVLVISDQTSGAGVLLESTRLRGVLRGNALGQPQIINLLPDERVKPGERVITSGGDQIYPRGLPVGVVDQVVPDTSNPPYIDILIKPAANLGHLEEVLVITQASDQIPAKAQQDMAQSAAEGAALGKQRASDILAERLPGLNDPSALADPGQGQKPAAAAATTVPAPLHPPPTLHADHFSPQATPPANALTPGQTIVDPKYAPAPKPQADATPAVAKPATDGKTTVSKKPEPGGDATAQPTPNSALAKPKRLATNPVVPGDAATPGTTHPPVVKPKTPKPAVPDQPAATPAPPADGGQPQ
ncbi:MAG: rod shape-determining protein MreC [Acidobacteriaceae bacterium]